MRRYYRTSSWLYSTIAINEEAALKFSVVTISFNQRKYLRECIESVLSQDWADLEYIIVDPGSEDGSRELIRSYRDPRIVTVFEADKGPADGLNRGFSRASGDVFAYLNSDDVFLPGALRYAADELQRCGVDVVAGHAFAVDSESRVLRRIFSDRFSLKRAAYGCSVTIQPSTFFRRSAFIAIGGFNVNNRSNWDGELLIDMARAGSSFLVSNHFYSCYRLHEHSITGTGRLASQHERYTADMFFKIMGRQRCAVDAIPGLAFRAIKHVSNPRAFVERLRRGPLFASIIK